MSDKSPHISAELRESLDILYEDNHLLAVNKPAGMLTQGDYSGDISILDVAKEWIRVHYNKPGRVFLALVHRLDRRVSGTLLLCRTSKGAGRISEQFRRRDVDKVYRALVVGTPSSHRGKVEGYLTKRNRQAHYSPKAQSGGKHSVIEYRLIQSDGKNSLVEVHPLTGRYHQIRALLSHLGHPILNDTKYGGPRRPEFRGAIGLHSSSLTVHHPTKKDPITFTSPAPSIWTQFIS